MIARLLAIALVLITHQMGALAQEQPGPYGPESPRLREQFWLVPGPESQMLRATVFRPPGEARRPLVVINHGTEQKTEKHQEDALPIFIYLSRWFVERGYVVVLPQRRGHGATWGRYAEYDGGCPSPDYARSGLESARDIEATIAFMRQQPFVSPEPALVVGQSAGGWAAMALASRNPPGVKAVVNFAGGRGGHLGEVKGRTCAPERLVSAAAQFGRTARLPSLWLYTENDSYFAPELSRRMAGAYSDAGGTLDFRLLPAFRSEGHSLAGHPDGPRVWGPLVERFLADLGERPIQVSR